RHSATPLTGNPDFIKIAEAYGAAGFRVQKPSELQLALERALEISDRPCIIECWTDPDEHVYPMIPAGGTIRDMILPPELRQKSAKLAIPIAA
ncbi:MAG TPA: acetolactate synthase large subunit, partial [Armatimonadetes bacterium]|nr:acetolactate synthase large subunit [Armatimonadota bacterium]